ncbi:MAG: hypothetical protein IJL87_10120 [Clostridia bacterium]|nr:hypothetical protein [Clostridia bacterium]
MLLSNEPFGIYAGRTSSLADLPDGAIVAVPNNVTNEARALLLLAQEGIITLKADAGITATVEDITSNPKNIQLKELAPEQLVAETYGNIIATTPEKANDEALLALVEVLQSEEISKFINDTYDGAVVPLK